jgi:hypothetical protein
VTDEALEAQYPLLVKRHEKVGRWCPDTQLFIDSDGILGFEHNRGHPDCHRTWADHSPAVIVTEIRTVEAK